MRAVIVSLTPQAQGGIAAKVMRVFETTVVRVGDALRLVTLDPLQSALVWIGGDPAPHGRQGWTSLFGYPSRWWRPARPEKPAPSLL